MCFPFPLLCIPCPALLRLLPPGPPSPLLLTPSWAFFAGVDPKSIMCEFFKVGKCTKGFKCKFSHDKAATSKGAKIDIFQDARDGEEGESPYPPRTGLLPYVACMT